MKLIVLLSAIAVFFVDVSYPQQILYSQSTGNLTAINWNTAANGSGTNEDPSGNDLVIQGHTITIDADFSINSATIKDGGTFVFDGTTPRQLTIINDANIESGGKFRSHISGLDIVHSLFISGDIINNGEFDMAVTSTRVCDVTFNKNGNQSVSGNTCVFNRITLNMGTNNSNILDILSVFTMISDGLTLLNGALKISSPSTILPFSGSDSRIPPSAGLIIDNPSAVIQKGTAAGLIDSGFVKIESGTVNIGANATSEFEITGSNANFIINGGQLNLSGRWKQASSSTVTINGGTINVSTDGASNSNIAHTFLAQTSSKLIMTGGTITIANRNSSSGGGEDFRITTGASNIQLTGGTIIFGSGPATNGNLKINPKGTFYNIVIGAGNNNVSILDASSLIGSLTLNSGITDLLDNNLTLGSSSTILGNSPSASNMIVTSGAGKLQKIFSSPSSFTFPVGDNNGTPEYSPATINFTSGSFSNKTVGISVKNEKHPEINLSSTNYINRYWSVSTDIASAFTADVEFNYNTTDVVGPEANIVSAKWDGAVWLELDPIDDTNKKLTGNVSSFSDFSGAEPTALPVELTNFSAKISGKNVQLFWETAAEIDNYGFEIERKKSGNEWKKISFVEGHGNSNAINRYNFVDKNLLPEKYSYRLKQIDNSGVVEYSKLISVEFSLPKDFVLYQNYPNPFNPTTTINFNLPKESYVKLEIFNILGEKVADLIKEFLEEGYHSFDFNAGNFDSGIYFYKVTADELIKTKKMLLLK